MKFDPLAWIADRWDHGFAQIIHRKGFKRGYVFGVATMALVFGVLRLAGCA